MDLFIASGIRKIPLLNQFLGEPKEGLAVGWGRKKSYFDAQNHAKKNQLNLLCLEDGFIRSMGLGKDGYPPLSLVVDRQGIYFDAYVCSDLENYIQEEESIEENIRAKHVIDKMLQHGVTKYNQKFQPIFYDFFNQSIKHILVVDQTFGDQSVEYSGAHESYFDLMLKRACLEHPNAKIWIKTHPDVLAKKAKGYFSKQQFDHKNVEYLTENFNPIELLKHIDEVYVVSSQLGFEALMCGKKVHCFGVPWYAGWGLTNDIYAPLHILKKRRNKKRSLEHLFACAYFKYARYISPISEKSCEIEDILDLIILNIQHQKKLNHKYIAYGFSLWKKNIIRDFLSFPKLYLAFRRFLFPQKDQYVLAWGKKAKHFQMQGFSHVTTVEDGFIRSVGLGAELHRAHSLVFDNEGIYYDATQPSKLENLLKDIELSAEQKVRSQQLIAQIIRLNISKYNVGCLEPMQRPEHEHVLLVIGQVEDDLSVQLGGTQIKSNLQLLQKVRELNPESYIIYKPHPDVQKGLRKGKVDKDSLYKLANQVEEYYSILQCFQVCDEVHTITSLSGFEALLRQIPVYCYGLPFYAGWGLTNDQDICERRGRALSLEELVYGSLIEYAFYNLPTTTKYLPLVRPEDVIHYLKNQLEITHQKQKLQTTFFQKIYK